MVSGNPMWLFRFPSVFVTRPRSASTAAVKSLVEVFPLLPVMFTIFAPSVRR